MKFWTITTPHINNLVPAQFICIKLVQTETNEDNWFLVQSQSCESSKQILHNRLRKKAQNIIALNKKRNKNSQFSNPTSTFEVFDLFSMGDLQKIMEENYTFFEDIFKQPLQYKNQELPIYGTKTHLINKINQIRCARNDIFHNKPTKIRFRRDLEVILLRLGYNLKDAIDIGKIQDGVQLKYKYEWGYNE